MSFHYPDHVATFGTVRRTKSERIAELVSRYPGVSDSEAKEIVSFMRNGRHLEIGMLTANDAIRPNLDAFMADHKAEFQVKWWETALVGGGIAAALIAFWLLWEAFA